MANTPEHIWRYGGIDVVYDPTIDCSGTNMVEPFVRLIRERFGSNRRFDSVFEWCAGAGFLGFALLAEGLCNSLCLADINPAAAFCVKRTIIQNRLHDRVRSYVSDNLLVVPRSECFDLVIGNPPSFCAPNPADPGYRARVQDIGGYDPSWKIHAGFYEQIGQFLKLGAHVLSIEVELFAREVFLAGSSKPLDIRPEEPHLAFGDMIRRGGLTHIDDIAFQPQKPMAGLKFWVQLSRK